MCQSFTRQLPATAAYELVKVCNTDDDFESTTHREDDDDLFDAYYHDDVLWNVRAQDVLALFVVVETSRSLIAMKTSVAPS